jgi:sugar transferase (PEP-CTERM system associated)
VRVVNQLRSNNPRAVLAQLVAELAWLLIAVILARWIDGQPNSTLTRNIAPAVTFALIMVTLNVAFGLYDRGSRLPLKSYAMRLLVAMLIGAPIAYLSAEVLPGGAHFREIFVDVVILAFAGLVLVRQILVSPLLRTRFAHNVLVIGTGTEARGVESALEAGAGGGFRLRGFYAFDQIAEQGDLPVRTYSRDVPLVDLVRRLRIDEVIVAVREQRGGGLPLQALLDCRLRGVQVTDLPRFFERVYYRIPIESLKASWLIYGNGFRQDAVRTAVKRLFDIVASLALLAVMMPVIVIVTLLITMESGGPVIYRQERVGLKGKTFQLLKFRSMRADAEPDGKPTWAAVDDPRVTRLGSFLRRSRVDELPQLLNVLKGEMSLVGPRPERPVFVAMLTEQIPFYGVRHSVKPGITGWAQVRYSYGADVAQSMKKLEYDLYYVKNHSLLLDIRILVATVRVVLLGEGAR